MEEKQFRELVELLRPISMYCEDKHIDWKIENDVNNSNLIRSKIELKTFKDYFSKNKKRIFTKLVEAKKSIGYVGGVEEYVGNLYFMETRKQISTNGLISKDAQLFKQVTKFMEKLNKEIEIYKKDKEKERFTQILNKYQKLAERDYYKNPTIFAVTPSWLETRMHENNDELIGNGIQKLVRIINNNLGITKTPKKIRITLPKEIKETIFKRDKGVCQNLNCKADLNHSHSAWEVDHIDCNPANNKIENLRLLCRTCNKRHRIKKK